MSKVEENPNGISRRQFLAFSGDLLKSVGYLALPPNLEPDDASEVLDIEPTESVTYSVWPMDGDPLKMIGDGINPPLGYRHLQATVDTKMNMDGGHHIGVDFNLGDENDDLGAPLNMIANGVCIFTGESNYRDLGKVAIFCCKLPDGQLVYPRYAHMLDWDVSAGQEINVGQLVGKCGKSGWEKGNAHLHLDVGTRQVLEDHYTGIFADPWWYPHKAPVAYIERYYIDPVNLIETYLPTQNNSDSADGLKDLARYRKWVARREYFRHRRK